MAAYRKKESRVVRSAADKSQQWRFLRWDDVQEVFKAAFISREQQELPEELEMCNTSSGCARSPMHKLLMPATAIQRAKSQQQQQQSMPRGGSQSPRCLPRRCSDGEPPQS